MPYVELAAGAYLLAQMTFIKTHNALSTAILKAPAPIFGAIMAADALSRLAWI